VDGASTPTAAALRRAVTAHAAGDTVSLSWSDASGTEHTADVTLGRAPVA
jgi:S1-C subfamily serine protease